MYDTRKIVMVAVTAPADIEAVARLAREIWEEHYTPIIGRAQVDYMLATFQSAEAIARQIAAGYAYFLAMSEGAAVGYFAIVPDAAAGRALLSKLYVRKAARGHGVGRAMIAFVDASCAAWGIRELWLTVNRNNAGSIAFYRRVGFVVAGTIVQDIGNGFVMDDYRMARPVPACPA